jgi:hypothetical protein
LNHRAGRTLDETGYRAEFRRHFEFGCQRLQEIWQDSGNDQARFVTALLKLTGEDFITGGSGPGSRVPPLPVVETPVKLNAEQRELLRKFDESLKGDGGKHTPRAEGFLDGVRRFFMAD